MENASNALLMAGGILIGVLILSLTVYLFMDFSSTSAEITAKKNEQKIMQFNSRFTSYIDKKDTTIYDIISLAKYAKKNNKYYGYEQKEDSNNINYIAVNTTIKNLEQKEDDELDAMIVDMLENDEPQVKYTVKSIDYHNNGRIKSITFQ